jgi:NitT/TauT family transport system substrate-binding protein
VLAAPDSQFRRRTAGRILNRVRIHLWPAIVAALIFANACSPAAPPPAAVPATAPPAATPLAAANTAPKPAGASSASPAASPAAAASAVASPVSVATQPAAAAPTGPVASISMGYSNISTDDTASYVASDEGIFTRHGLDVNAQLVAGGSTTTAALLAGQTQISQNGGSETLSAVANGADLVVVATLAGVYPYLFEVTPDIKTMQDVVGKKLGVSNIGGSADIALRVALRANGIDPEKDVTIIATGSSQNRTAALIAGAIQGGMAGPPDSLAIEAIGLHPILDLASQHLPSANTVVAVQRSYAVANHGIVQRYVDALIDAIVQLKRDRPGTIAILEKYYQSNDDHAMGIAYDFYANEVAEVLPFPRPEQFKDAIDALSVTNPKIRDVDLGKLLDSSFVQNAADRGLGH